MKYMMKIKQKNINIEYLINNAGFGDYGFFTDTDWKKEEEMIDLNIKTLTFMTKLFLKDMTEKGRGKIMNVASVAGFLPGPLMSVYYATKAYVLSFSRAINNELKDRGITVTALCPGPTESNFQEISGMSKTRIVQKFKMPSSAVVAEYGYKSMQKGKSVAVQGFLNKMTVFIVRFIPGNAVVSMTRKLQES